MNFMHKEDFMGAIKSAITNWLTSVAGTVTGVPLIIAGFAATPDDWYMILAGIGAMLTGLFAKQANVTGGTKPQ